MEIVLGKYAGFCPGVKRAWALVEKAVLKKDRQVYILGELIHNDQALEQLKKWGAKTIENPQEIKGQGRVVIRAHGEPPQTFRQLLTMKDIQVIDATCPSVRRVQALASDLENKGFAVFICGEKDHPEARATVGYTRKGKIITSLFEAQRAAKTQKMAVLSQTTFSPVLFKKIGAVLKRKTQDFKSLGTICNFTQLAQKEARQIARHVDLVIVVGGRQSSNTRRLTEVAKEVTPTHHVETAKEIKKPWFVGIKTVGLLAGASTPDWIIKEAEEKTKNMVHNQNWTIVAAGGRGERMGKKINKIFLPLLREPVIFWTLKTLEESPVIEKILITAAGADLRKLKKTLKKYRFKKIIGFVKAGESRQDSTLKALQWMRENGARNDDLVGVHNATNPLVTAGEIEDVFSAAKRLGAALLAMPARDTVKIADNSGFVVQTPTRKLVWYAQTPQVGRFKEMWEAFLKAKKDNFQGTDDAQLLERTGVKVKTVPCSPENFKITYHWDLILAKAILKKRNV